MRRRGLTASPHGLWEAQFTRPAVALNSIIADHRRFTDEERHAAERVLPRLFWEETARAAVAKRSQGETPPTRETSPEHLSWLTHGVLVECLGGEIPLMRRACVRMKNPTKVRAWNHWRAWRTAEVIGRRQAETRVQAGHWMEMARVAPLCACGRLCVGQPEVALSVHAVNVLPRGRAPRIVRPQWGFG